MRLYDLCWTKAETLTGLARYKSETPPATMMRCGALRGEYIELLSLTEQLTDKLYRGAIAITLAWRVHGNN